MERVDGDCTCMEGYYLDPEDDTKCVAYTTTEAPENLAVWMLAFMFILQMVKPLIPAMNPKIL